MTFFTQVVSFILICMMALSLVRVFRGPTIFDRLAGLGLLGTKTVVLLVLVGHVRGRIELYADIALAYALISFIGSLILAKYFETKGDVEK